MSPSLPHACCHACVVCRSVVQYADDTLIILQGEARQLQFLKSVLNTFYASTGLKINCNKSMMVPINISKERFQHLANTFGCAKGTLPFTYLGLPLGTTKPRVEDFLPLVNKCERRLASVSTFLTQAGRLELVNSVFSSLPPSTCVPFLYFQLLLNR